MTLRREIDAKIPFSRHTSINFPACHQILKQSSIQDFMGGKVRKFFFGKPSEMLEIDREKCLSDERRDYYLQSVQLGENPFRLCKTSRENFLTKFSHNPFFRENFPTITQIVLSLKAPEFKHNFSSNIFAQKIPSD